MHVDEKITRSLMMEDIAGDIWNIIMYYIGENKSPHAKMQALLFWLIFQDFAHPVNGKNYSVQSFNNDPRGRHRIKLYYFSWLKRFSFDVTGNDYVMYWIGVREPFHEIAKAANKHERDAQFQTYKDIQKNIRAIMIHHWKVTIRKYKNQIQKSLIQNEVRDPREAMKRTISSLTRYMGNKVAESIIEPMENMFDEIFQQVIDLINKKAREWDFLLEGPTDIQKRSVRVNLVNTESYMVKFFLRIRASAKRSSSSKGTFFGSHNFTKWVQRRTIYGNLRYEFSTDSEISQVFSDATNVFATSNTLSADAEQLAADGLAITTFNMDVDEAMADPITGLRDEVYVNIPVYKYLLVESYDVLESFHDAQFPVLLIEQKLTGLVIVNLNMEALRLGFRPNMFIQDVVEPSESAAGAQETTFRIVRFLPTIGSVTEEEALTADLGNEYLTPDVSEGLDVIMSF